MKDIHVMSRDHQRLKPTNSGLSDKNSFPIFQRNVLLENIKYQCRFYGFYVSQISYLSLAIFNLRNPIPKKI